jgi:hypothetical protein
MLRHAYITITGDVYAEVLPELARRRRRRRSRGWCRGSGGRRRCDADVTPTVLDTYPPHAED